MEEKRFVFPYDIAAEMADLDLCSSVRDLIHHGWTRDEIKHRVDEVINKEVGE